MNALSIIQEADVRHDNNQSAKEQARLLSESEMVATGLLKFDIFEETDRNLDEFAGHPILEDSPLANSEISKQIKLYQVIADESRESLKSSNQEAGQLYITLRFKINNFDFQLFQEARIVQKHFFDTFLQDEEQISFHLARVEELLALRSGQWQRTVDLYDRKTAKLHDAATELARLRIIQEAEEKEIEALEARLFRLQSIDEIHIEIDVLQGTSNGIDQLKERLYKLNGRLAMARK